MKISIQNIKQNLLSSLIIGSILLTGCTVQRHVLKLDKIQSRYDNAVSLNERYFHGLYGQPDPASFNRLKQYQYEAYQALTQFRGQFDKTKPIPKEALENANHKIDIYVSYLNALGATSATKDTFTGF